MDITQIGQIISTVGFPIAACIAIFWLNNKQSEQHREEMNKMTDALNNNTQALVRLSERIAVLEGGNAHVGE